MKVYSYSVEDPIKGMTKQHAVWATAGGRTVPLIYLQRPKWITNNDQWNTIVKAVRLDLSAGFEVKKLYGDY
jgi:hypothetical protein